MRLFYILSICFSLFLITACGDKSPKETQQMPEWIMSGSSGSGTCYVGSSRPHIKGLPYQKALAVSRAIEGIARQKGVQVDVQVETLMRGTSKGASTSMSSYSVQTTTGQNVTAKIKKTWMNPSTQEIFILMCED
jgi:hypothetical protein